MRGHLYLSSIAARLRSAAADGLPGEPPEQIKALLEKLEQLRDDPQSARGGMLGRVFRCRSRRGRLVWRLRRHRNSA
jgi:hypothetical protein